MSYSSAQFAWLSTVKSGLDLIFEDEPHVFVAACLEWFPEEESLSISITPDVMVVFETEKRDRAVYNQWQENGIAPQVVFQTLPTEKWLTAMARFFDFYQQHGVEEYYLYDPERKDFAGYIRSEEADRLTPLDDIDGWISPRLDIEFRWSNGCLTLHHKVPGEFVPFLELAHRYKRLKATYSHTCGYVRRLEGEYEALCEQKKELVEELEAIEQECQSLKDECELLKMDGANAERSAWILREIQIARERADALAEQLRLEQM